ncbi:unnamed protein product, partial [Candidula unifasciata]
LCAHYACRCKKEPYTFTLFSFVSNYVNMVSYSVIEFASSSDMRNAIEKLDGTEINGRKIRLVEDKPRRRSRSRSRSKRSSRSQSGSRSRSRSRSRSPSDSKRPKSGSRSVSPPNKKSASRSRSASRSHDEDPDVDRKNDD